MLYFNEIISKLEACSIEYKIGANTKDYVSFKVGGLASIIVFPKNKEELIHIFKAILRYGCNYFILGNGTNTYFSDSKYDGVIIVTKYINQCFLNGNYLTAYCGASIKSCCELALNSSLSGLEFAYGIPGTVGGAVYMNASAFNKSISCVVDESAVIDLETLETFVINLKEHGFSTKESIFSKNKRLFLLSTTFSLKKDIRSNVFGQMSINAKKRLETQPLELPNAGSVFKRPKKGYASKLIEKCGLKGKRIGGAEVSKKHAGFIVNIDNATASDIRKLTEYVKQTVKEKEGIILEEEIIFVE